MEYSQVEFSFDIIYQKNSPSAYTLNVLLSFQFKSHL